MSKPGPEGLHWGIDVGGTTVIIGYLSRHGFKRMAVLDNDPSSSPESVIDLACRTIRQHDRRPATAGAGVAGLVDRNEGVVLSSPNMAGWRNFHIRRRLRENLECPVAIDNDCNVFALQALESSIIPVSGLWLMVTLGTGIGGTIILDGDIIYGSGYAGEFGHMTVEARGRECPCGSSGCWERYAASSALVGYYSSSCTDGRTLSPREIALLAESGDKAAEDAFEEFGRWIGIGMANLYQCFSPHGIYLAGGLSNSGAFFLPAARREFQKRCSHRWNVNLLPSVSDAGAEGAALLGRNSV